MIYWLQSCRNMVLKSLMQGSHAKTRIEVAGRVWYDTLVKPHGGKKFVNPKSVRRLLKMIDEAEAWKAAQIESEENDNDDESE
jgi:hypothetical protein